MRLNLVLEISREDLVAALANSDQGHTVSISTSNAKPAQAKPAQATPAAKTHQAPAPAAPSSAPAAEKGKPGRKSNAQKEAEAKAAAEAAASSSDSEELSLDAELEGDDAGAEGDDSFDNLLQDDEETADEDEVVGDDNVLKRKLADALQANKKKNNGKAAVATEILRKYEPNLSVPNVKKKDVPALLKDLAK